MFEEIAQGIRAASNGMLDGVSTPLVVCISVTGVLIGIASIVAFVISVYLGISYIKYNRRANSLGMTGEQIAREMLDANDLQHIGVTCSGSLLFGNSYSHYFHKVRLRRLTWLKDSITSMAMASQKASLAILDKMNDPDMVARVRLTPVIYFGPIAFIPIVIIGMLLDVFVFNNTGVSVLIATGLGVALYAFSFIMALMELKTEKKAQNMALVQLEKHFEATHEEIEMCRKLFKLYNIEYVNNMIMALLELVYRVLIAVAKQKMNNK